MLLTSIMVTSIFSVALTAKTSGGKGTRKLKAAVGARAVSAMLRNYVSADLVQTTIPGPGTLANPWSMTSGGIVDACPGGGSTCYAFAGGTHTLTGVLDPTFEASPYNARVRYFVDDTAIVNGRPVPAVTITTTWDEP